MKPSILQGHTRPIKSISFNSSSSTLYSASNDRCIIAWDMETKEKIKAFNHAAAINTFTLSSCDKYIVSGDNTGTFSIWDVEYNTILSVIEGDPLETIKSISFSGNSKDLLICFSGRTKNSKSKIRIFDFFDLAYEKNSLSVEEETDRKDENCLYNNESIYSSSKMSSQSSIENVNVNKAKKKSKKEKEKEKEKEKPSLPRILQIENLHSRREFISESTAKYVKAIYVEDDKFILIGKDDGSLELIDSSNGKQVLNKKLHSDQILDLDYHSTLRFIVTSGADGYCFIVGFDTFQVFFKFHPENPTRNINSCRLMLVNNPFLYKKKVNIDEIFDVSSSITDKAFEDKYSQLRKAERLPLLVFGGGQDSKLVTTTHPKDGGFEVIVYEIISGTQLLSFQSHFGPVNTVGCSNTSSNDMRNKVWLASGSEDATVRLYDIEENLRGVDV